MQGEGQGLAGEGSWRSISDTLTSIVRLSVLTIFVFRFFLSDPLDVLYKTMMMSAIVLKWSLDFMLSIDLWAVQWLKLFVGSVLGACLSNLLDKNTHKTDAAIFVHCNALLAKAGNGLQAMNTMIEQNAALSWLVRSIKTAFLCTTSFIRRGAAWVIRLAKRHALVAFALHYMTPFVMAVLSFRWEKLYNLLTGLFCIDAAIAITNFVFWRWSVWLAVREVLPHVKNRVLAFNQPVPSYGYRVDHLVAELETDETLHLNLQGLRLTDIWNDVEEELWKDKRLCETYATVEGKLHAFWRRYEGNME